jgi:hypothetical protein
MARSSLEPSSKQFLFVFYADLSLPLSKTAIDAHAPGISESLVSLELLLELRGCNISERSPRAASNVYTSYYNVYELAVNVKYVGS